MNTQNRVCEVTHGKSGTRLYKLWLRMKRRCNNPHHDTYKYYGGRGIKVCDQWDKDFQAFEQWALSHGYAENAPKGVCTLDRVNTDGDYSPENCRFVDMTVQMNNTRRNRKIIYNGETHTLAEWSRILDVPYSRLITRLNKYHWTVERAFTEEKRVNQFG